MFWLCAIIAALMPLLPKYLAQIGVSASDIALLFAVQALTSLVLAQWVGFLADTRLQRTTMLVWMALLASVVAAVVPLAGASLPLLALCMVCFAIFISQNTSLLNGLILDSARGDQIYGRVRVSGSISYAILAPLIGWLADMPLFTVAVIWPILVVTELMFAVSIMKLRDVPPVQRSRAGEKRISFRKAQAILLGNPLMVRFLVFTCLCQMIAGPWHLMQAKVLSDLGSGAMFIASALAFGAVAEISIFFYGNQVLSRIRLMPLLAVIPAALAVKTGLVYAFPTPWVIFFSNIFHIFGFGLAYICGIMFIHREAPRDLANSSQSLYALVFSPVASLLGNGLMWGMLLVFARVFGIDQQQGLILCFGVGAIWVLLAYLAWVPMKRDYQRKHRVSGFWIR